MKTWRILAYVISTIGLLGTIVWFIKGPEFEPFLAILGAILTLGGLLFSDNSEDFQKLKVFFKKIQFSKKSPHVIVGVITISLCVILGYFITIVLSEQRTIYFLVDASENMKSVLPEVGPRIGLNTLQIPKRAYIGLAVFGGSLRGKTGCDDITQLVEPSPQTESAEKLSEAVGLLTQIEPRNRGGLQNAVAYVIEQLPSRKGVQQIFVITSSIDIRCEKLDRTALDQIATKEGVEYEIIITPIGDISTEDQKLLEEFAYGRVIKATTLDDILSVIQEVINSPVPSYSRYTY